jgi:hypothetical protein
VEWCILHHHIGGSKSSYRGWDCTSSDPTPRTILGRLAIHPLTTSVEFAHAPVPKTPGNTKTGTKYLGNAAARTIWYFQIWKSRTVRWWHFQGVSAISNDISSTFLKVSNMETPYGTPGGVSKVFRPFPIT